MGPSGSGKTSLLNVLAQRVPRKNVSSGGVFVDGRPLLKTFKRRMGFVFQVRLFRKVRKHVTRAAIGLDVLHCLATGFRRTPCRSCLMLVSLRTRATIEAAVFG